MSPILVCSAGMEGLKSCESCHNFHSFLGSPYQSPYLAQTTVLRTKIKILGKPEINV